MTEKKIIIFNDKQFYNAKHLYDYLTKYYYHVHQVDYLTVRSATGKRLKSIDKVFQVSYEMVSESHKQRIKKYMQITEGYEYITAFDIKNFDDFIIHTLSLRDIGYLYVFKNTRKQLVLAYKMSQLKKLATAYNAQLVEHFMTYIVANSYLYENYHYYYLNPSQFKQIIL